MGGEAIDGRPDGPARAQRAEVLDEEGLVERLRHVVVERGARRCRQGRAVSIVRIVSQPRGLARAERGDEGVGEAALAAAAASSDADEQRRGMAGGGRAHAATAGAGATHTGASARSMLVKRNAVSSVCSLRSAPASPT